ESPRGENGAVSHRHLPWPVPRPLTQVPQPLRPSLVGGHPQVESRRMRIPSIGNDGSGRSGKCKPPAAPVKPVGPASERFSIPAALRLLLMWISFSDAGDCCRTAKERGQVKVVQPLRNLGKARKGWRFRFPDCRE